MRGYVREHELRGLDIWVGYASGSVRWPFAAALASVRFLLVKAREFVLADYSSTPHRGDWGGLARFDGSDQGNITRIR